MKTVTILLVLLLAELPKQGAEAFPVTCCLKTCESKVRKELLKSYSLQDQPLCPVKAVRFVTKTDITICWDPFSLWAINTMAFMDNRDTLTGNTIDTNNNNNTLSYI